MKAERLVIVDGVRTPFCKAGTELAAMSAVVRTKSTSVDDPLGRPIPCVHGLLRGT